MPFWKQPQWGWALHLGVSIAPILINIMIAYIVDPSNPLGLRADVLAGIVTLLNVVLSQLRNAGQSVVTVSESARTDGPAPNLHAGQTVIVPSQPPAGA